MKQKKELTVREFAQLGDLARAKKYGKRRLRAWEKLGGRPPKKIET